MDQLIDDFSIGQVFWVTVLLLIMIFVLAKFAWKPILNGINKRERGIENALASAEAARKEMKKLKESNQEAKREARQERDEMLKEARKIKDKIIAEASEEAERKADKIIVDARENIDNERRAALADIKATVAELSIDIAEKVTRRELEQERAQMQLVEKLLAEADIKEQRS